MIFKYGIFRYQKMIVIGVQGQKYHGKDTFADYLVKHYGFEKRAFADPLKQMIIQLFGFDHNACYGTTGEKEAIHPEWGVSARQVMQKVGTELFRNQLQTVLPDINLDGHEFWAHLMHLYLKKLPKDARIVVPDVRFKDENDLIQSHGGVSIRVVRPSLQQQKAEHASEELDVPFDFRIFNDDSVEKFEQKIETFMLRYFKLEKTKNEQH